MALMFFKDFIRSHVEFAITIWFPYLKGEINLLESVQRKAAKWAPTLRKLNYLERLEKLKLLCLEFRRLLGDLIQTYKFIHGLDIIYEQIFTKFIDFSTDIATRFNMS